MLGVLSRHASNAVLAARAQERNYVQRKENERRRKELFDDGLVKFNKGDIEVRHGKGLMFCWHSSQAVSPCSFPVVVAYGSATEL